MAHPKTSLHKNHVICGLLFLILALYVILWGRWWPDTALAVGIPLALRFFLLGKYFDTSTTLLCFVGFYVLGTFDIDWQALLYALFGMGAVYILLKEWVFPYTLTEQEKEEAQAKEISDKDS